MMRRLPVLLFLVVLCFTLPASASVVITAIPGLPADNFAFVDAMWSSPNGCSSSFDCAGWDGELLTAIYRNETNDNLLFLWQLANTSTVTDFFVSAGVWRFMPPDMPSNSVLGRGYTSDLGLEADLGTNGYAPYSLATGAIPTIGFFGPITQTFFGLDLSPGAHSTLWYVYTDAHNYRGTDPNAVSVQLTANALVNGLTESANFDTFEPAPVPEPASLFLMGSGLVGLAGAMRRKLAKQ